MTLEPVVATIVGAILLGQAIGLQGILAVASSCPVAALGVTISDRRDSARSSQDRALPSDELVRLRGEDLDGAARELDT